MAIYTAHEPPPGRNGEPAAPERFVFVRDGFSFWAFLFGPLWILRHRMWLVFFGFVAVAASLDFATRWFDISSDVGVVVALLLALLIGFEAGTLRRFTLARRKWTNIGVIVGDDLESAERRFFDAWTKREIHVAAVHAAAMEPPPLHPQAAEHGVTDLGPPAEAPR